MIVGEAPGETEERLGTTFVGPSGMEMDRMLQEAGILRNECFVTNVCNARPPKNDMGQWLIKLKNPPKPENRKYSNKTWVRWKDKWAHPFVVEGYNKLVTHIGLIKPDVVIAFGNTALFALTGEWGIKKWRGSQLMGEVNGHKFKVIPAYHPAAVLREWAVRPITVRDLRRAKVEIDRGAAPYVVPNYDRIIRPTFNQVVRWFGDLRMKLNAGQVEISDDVETRAGHLACVGMYTPGLPTICIPLMCIERTTGYWTEAEELYIWNELREIHEHPNAQFIGQNFVYDCQYYWRFLFVRPRIFWDTLVAQHTIFPGTPKGLDYLASLYCGFYKYWKDDGKLWDPKLMPEDDFWKYNCEDCERTHEVYLAQKKVIYSDPRLASVWDFQINKLYPRLFKAMIRGIRADVKNKGRLSNELGVEIDKRQQWLDAVCGHHLNFRSPLQLKKFFYDDLQIKPIFNRKTGAVTTDDDALIEIAKRQPLVAPICRTIQECRSIGVFKSTFIEMRLDRDQRIRCSFNIGGTRTFRLSSDSNAFGSGGNLQNVPAGNDDPDPGDLELPNVRKLFIPDEGMTLFDMDLKNADFYTVVWEADDEEFREALEAGVDQHLLNASKLFPKSAECTIERLRDPAFIKYAKARYKKERDFAKIWCHGTNYGGGDRTMAANAGILVRENEQLRRKWFGEHPGIKQWHERVEDHVKRHRWIENRFGYRWRIFDRIEGCLPEALAWVPQSTTGCVINRIWDQLDSQIRDVEVMLQVHDSLVGQYPTHLQSEMLTRLPEVAKVVVPYDRPLVIPVGIKTSEISWGHCG